MSTTAGGQAGEAGDFDAIAFVGAAGFDAAQKNDFVAGFVDGDVDVANAGDEALELGEFVIVRGEKSARTRVGLERFDDGPGERQAIECGGAAADFVEKDQARGRRGIQNDRDFAHFNQESGTAAGEIIGSADAREDAVDERQLGLRGRDE